MKGRRDNYHRDCHQEWKTKRRKRTEDGDKDQNGDQDSSDDGDDKNDADDKEEKEGDCRRSLSFCSRAGPEDN